MKSKSSKATGRIQIIHTPAGKGIPLRIRKAWRGLVLPCHPILGFSQDRDREVMSRKKLARNRYCFSVPQRQALFLLERKDPLAAAWWRLHVAFKAGECFGFAEGEARIIRGVRRQEIIEVTDEMMGNPDR